MDDNNAFQPGVPSPAQQSWGAVISIVIIVLMIIIGAYYSWSKRVGQIAPANSATALDALSALATSSETSQN